MRNFITRIHHHPHLGLIIDNWNQHRAVSAAMKKRGYATGNELYFLFCDAASVVAQATGWCLVLRYCFFASTVYLFMSLLQMLPILVKITNIPAIFSNDFFR